MRFAIPFALFFLAACGDSTHADGGLDMTAPADFGVDASPADANVDAGPQFPARALMNFGADLTATTSFYDLPYPSDLRLTADGHPDLRGFPLNAHTVGVMPLRDAAAQHDHFLMVPVGYFRFTAPLASVDWHTTIAASTSSPVMLIDVDPTSPDRGTLYPVVADVPARDQYVPTGLLAIAPRPGIVLEGRRTYAFVVTTDVQDMSGASVLRAPEIEQLAMGTPPSGALGPAAPALYQKLFDTLATLGVPPARVASATVFTTGDVVQELADLAAAVSVRDHVTIGSLALDPDDGVHPTYCELHGTVTYPQYQVGTPPFDSDGLFMMGADGLPVVQRMETAPVAITIPRSAMAADGYPLVVYFHGSGGVSTQVVDRGTWHYETDVANCPPGEALETWDGHTGCDTKGEGPAFTLAPYGFAAAGSALPLNPERLPGATEIAYLNLINIASGRDTFRQGVIEQRLFLDALLATRVPLTTLAGCTGVTLPAGVTDAFFDATHVYAQGQSMGGMYANLIAATDPRYRAVVATGAGGYWSHFILFTHLFADPSIIPPTLLGSAANVSFLHPGMQLFETGWEAIDPIVFAVRVARKPLAGHPQRSVYEPVALGDSFFGTETYDAMATSYAHREAGAAVWPTMQDALALVSRDGLVTYPVANDVTAVDGTPYTGAVLQYMGDGVYDPHAIVSQLPEVKHQYACFLSTHFTTGTATVVAPGDVGTPCM